MRNKILLLLCTILIMTSCNSLSNIPPETEKITNHVSAQNTEEIETERITNHVSPQNTEEIEVTTEFENPFELYDWRQISSDGGLGIGHDNIALPKEEALAFLSYFDEQFSSSFIKYAELCSLGDIEYMILTEADEDNIRSLIKYIYTLRIYDDHYRHGYFEFAIHVEHLTASDSRNIVDYKPRNDSLDIDLKHESPQNMATSRHKSKSMIHEDRLYQYDSNGEVKWISMIVDDYFITLGRCEFFGEKNSHYTEQFYFKDYAPAEPNFITLLLEGAEYEEVANSFRQMIATEAE